MERNRSTGLIRMEWNGLDRNGMERNKPKWIVTEKNRKEWTGTDQNGTEQSGRKWNELERRGTDWTGMELNKRE